MARTKVWAHRGASEYAPENTLEAFKLAVEMKADGIELDVQFTKDKKLVICHDETINRVSNGKGMIMDYTLDELKEFDFNKTHPEYINAKIPTLEEVFKLISPTNLTINVELKTGVIFYEGIEKACIECAEIYGMSDRILYSSFNHYSVMKVRELCPDAKTAFLYSNGFIDVPEYAHKHGVNAVHPSLKELQYPNLYEKCQMLGLDINVWTVNSGKIMRELCECGMVNAIITNKPDLCREIADDYPI